MQISLEEYRKLSDHIAELERENEELRKAVACPPHWMHWISVKDRLPETGVRVLAQLYHAGIVIAYTFIDGTDKYWTSAGHDYINVTHWMPLPEPPEVEDVQG